MTTIILADKNETALVTLAEELQDQRPEWKTVLLMRGSDVLDRVAQNDIDCVVTEIVLDDTTGYELLGRLQSEFPDVIRLTLTADDSQEALLESSRTNNRFINRSAGKTELATSIENSLKLRQVLQDDALKHCIGETRTLPALPEIYQQMVQELTSPHSSLVNIASIIESDASLTATVLKIVNSAFYGLNQTVESVSQGVSMLGIHLIKNITLTAKVFSQFEGDNLDLNTLKQLNDDANKTGALTNHFARLARVSRTTVDHAQIAGMLCNTGRLLALSQSVTNNSQNATPDRELLGAYLLRLWLLPDTVIEAVALQHKPILDKTQVVTPRHILHAVRFLDKQLSQDNTLQRREECRTYLESIVSSITADRWLSAFCDMQLLTSHKDVDSSHAA